ncbi:bifunctional metallophosphatase/5'-nucleotidase [Haloferax larsenii]|uniref:2',3'-cyclic-nucleotide 2'-phosphodiesterase/5'-or 3'-nucleotidase, 5'-nucleotidase family n=1 Tax=Haloferax larsenii TaxID=302484 RepID=A0A1H7HT50_HALLR|nr:bifunctional UDP-sugar hydrolase/5'-nucleotidase [Haloferax larsenii]SEK52837.1 2',3'-cyclic-nucleotide 2'-phosphodiesterase/5'-or 3'-nucleotidase, 5'-nucleotidase family [Haloferax larsenii]
MESRSDTLRTILTVAVLFLVATTSPAAALTAGPAGANAGPAAPADVDSNATTNATNATTLTVLTYNDVQTAASNPTRMGRLVGVVNERRQAHDNPTVVVGGGDQVSPSSFSPTSQWRVPVDVLNTLGPDAEVVGNHDLDYGFDAVENYSAASEFPWLVANVVHEDGSGIPGTKNYTIVERDGVRVGVVGLVDDAIKSKTAVDFDEQGYRVADFSRVGSRVATKLKDEKNVDVVVAAAHIGVPESKELARNTDNIDLIVTGDDEVAYAPKTVDGTTIVEAEARGAYVGEVNLSVTDDGVSLASGRLVTVDENSSVNQTAETIVSDARSAQLGEVVGRTNTTLDSRFTSNYKDETAWGNLITDAFRDQTGSDVAVTNAGGIRGDFVIGPGNVTYDDVYTSLPFGNYLVTKRMTGEQLRELLASQVSTTDDNYGAQAQLQVSGVSYEYVPSENASPVVRDVYVNGEQLDEDAHYNVSVNSYMAGWAFEDRYGWSMAELPTTSEDYTLYGTVVAQYIDANSPVAPEDTNRIRRVDSHLGNVTVANPPAHAAKETVTVRKSVSSDIDSVNASSVVLQNATTGALDAESATVEDGELVVTFDQDEFRRLSDASQELELYAGYESSVYGDGYFQHAVANVDVNVPPGQDDSHPGGQPGSGDGGPPVCTV